MSAVAVAGMIGLYQRWLSPLKGFCCAYRQERKRCSCSEFGRRAVLRVGVMKFFPLMKQRFARCAAAAKSIALRKKTKHQPAYAVVESACGNKISDSMSALDCTPEDCGTAAECGCAAGELLAEFL